MAGRLSWGLGDQAVSSLTNFVVGMFVARSLGPHAFGVFSIAWVTYGVLLNVSRGLATDPLMVRYSGVSTSDWRAAVGRSSGTALAVGCVSGVGSLLAGLAIGGAVGHAFLALALALPALLLQDSWRFAFFAAGEGRRAFTADAIAAVALIPSMFVAAHFRSVVAFLLAWGVASAVAACFGLLRTGIVPRLGAVRGWVGEHRDLGPRYLIENVSNSGASQLRAYGLGAIAGLAAVGTVRGAEQLLGPFLALLMGLSLVTVAEGARVLRRSPHRLRLFCALLGTGQAAAAFAWGLGLLFLLPDSWGRFALGEVWTTSSQLILPVTFSVVGASLSTGAAAGLRALGAAPRSLRSQLVASTFYLGGGLVGAFLGGAVGSAWGVATATLTGSVVWWYQLHAGLREYVPPKTSSEEMTSS
ncbi:MATE family efflux transporter [Amycolatopsis samaneae]|uniref:O-antigen/teichoic acid export membrane protein n=1 Tax=Amycolatopsis samaneae TaxID=664691 RepID=A0ABW5GE14_9PSEU